MATTPKTGAEGQLPDTKTTLYTAPAVVVSIVKLISLVNTSASAIAVNLYLNLSGTSRRILPVDFSLAAAGEEGSQLLLENVPLYLSTGDLVEGDADTAAVVDYVVMVVEETNA